MEKLYFLLNSLYSISLLSSDQWDFSNWLFAKCTVIWLAVRFLWTDTLISWILRHFPGNQIKILFICIFTKSEDLTLILISTIQEFPALNQRNNFKKLNISSFGWKKKTFLKEHYTLLILAWPDIRQSQTVWPRRRTWRRIDLEASLENPTP